MVRWWVVGGGWWVGAYIVGVGDYTTRTRAVVCVFIHYH